MDLERILYKHPASCWTLFPISPLGLQLEERSNDGSISYTNTRMVQVSTGWRWFGRVHEHLQQFTTDPATGTPTPVQEPAVSKLLGPIEYVIHEAGGGVNGERYGWDEAILAEDVQKDPSNARAWFYLGHTRRALGDVDGAVRAYMARIELGGWREEVGAGPGPASPDLAYQCHELLLRSTV